MNIHRKMCELDSANAIGTASSFISTLPDGLVLEMYTALHDYMRNFYTPDHLSIPDLLRILDDERSHRGLVELCEHGLIVSECTQCCGEE